MRRDLLSAYGASVARIASWVVVSGAVYRFASPGAFALMSLTRGTIGILNYASVGLAPAMIRLLAEARAPKRAIPVRDSDQLDYAQPPPRRIDPVREVYVNGVAWSLLACCIGVLILKGYVMWIDHSRSIRSLAVEGADFAMMFGVGILFRLMSDAPSAALQTSGRIALDNLLVIAAEFVWALVATLSLTSHHSVRDWSRAVGGSFCFASALLLIARWGFASRTLPDTDIGRFKHLNPTILKRLLTFGSLVTAAQLADYLYAPTDFLLIAWLLHPLESATYGPAVQIDAGLLILVSALSSVILPRAALAHTSDNPALVRRYYLLGTLASSGILIGVAGFVWLLSPLIFRLWFGDALPNTQVILPLVLVHTILGGSSAVGRSILLAMGRVKPFTIAVLIAGIANVVLSWLFVSHFNLGLRGIVLGTIVAVTGRCAIWMPWYVIRALRENRQSP
jgi:O-antigen/teichoic acid export membrane protein